MTIRKCFIGMASASIIVIGILVLGSIPPAHADNAGNYIVTETGALSMITPAGARAVIYGYSNGTLGTHPYGVAIDSAGNNIVAEDDISVEYEDSVLSMVTPGGVRTQIYASLPYTYYDGVAIDSAGNYIVAGADGLSKITPGGVRTQIFSFASGTQPAGVAIDGSGNYIVTEWLGDKLSMITPAGVRTVIYSFASGTYPQGVAINSAGNYVVAESGTDKLSMITPGGVRTVIYSFASGSEPYGVAIDGSGTYIVTETFANKLSMITPGGVRTVIYSFASGSYPRSVAVVPGIASGYSATIWSWDVLGWIAQPITMDGVSTGFSTPHTFTGLTGTHTFTVPSTDIYGYPFSSWDTGETSTTLTVNAGGTHTAQYGSYVATIWSWDVLGWITQPITMDGVSTGFFTPHTFTGLTGTHTFTGLTGTHTFTVPSTDIYGYPFSSWDTGETSTTLTVNAGGTHTAQYGQGTCTTAPGKATLFSPSGTVTTATPTYAWNAVPCSTWYYLWVNDPTGTRIQQWVTAAQASCAGTATCSFTPTTALNSGAGQWWIQTWDDAGYGPWSTAMNFTVSGPICTTIPGQATPSSPSGTITTTMPTYTWNAVPCSSWYYLWVNDSSGNKIKHWYTAADVGCPSGIGTCSITPTTALANGSGQWWIQTWDDAGYGSWSSAINFTVSGPICTTIPGQATPSSPSGTITTTMPTYTWNAVPCSSWYYLWVNDSTGTRVTQWYTAAQANCPSGTGTCSAMPSLSLAYGSAQWWIQTWDDAGYGPWSSAKNFNVSP